MDSGFPQADVDLTPDMIAGAALLTPAFCEDLSTWRMTIARDGEVVQELNPTYKSELQDTVCIHLRSFVDANRLSEIQVVADEIGFESFESEYHSDWTDEQHTSITLNLGDKVKRVMAYGPHTLAEDGNADMIGYVRLWELMLEVSPYRKTVATSLPIRDARKRLRLILGRWL